MSEAKPVAEAKSQNVHVQYKETTALFASQVVVNAGGDELLLNFSSGYLVDPATGQAVLPIHTRIAMTADGARRLLATLSQALQVRQERVPGGEGFDKARAQFPAQMGQDHDTA